MRLNIKVVAANSAEETSRNIANAKRLGFPRLGRAETPRLAVVGGGRSIEKCVDELKAFDGDVWAINGAFAWCQERGIDAWFFTVDPTEKVVPYCKNVGRAMVAMDCHPAVFAALSGAHVEAIDLPEDTHGPITATAAPIIGLKRGYREFLFYGCEGNFNGTTHAYGDDEASLDMLLRVRCAGETFLTSADMAAGIEYLGEIIKGVPGCKDMSGGLLAAYLREPNIDIEAASPRLYQRATAA